MIRMCVFKIYLSMSINYFIPYNNNINVLIFFFIYIKYNLHTTMHLFIYIYIDIKHYHKA